MRKENGVLYEVTNADLKVLLDNPREFWKDVKEIGRYAFEKCNKLNKLLVPGSVKKVGDLSFMGSSFKEVVFHKGTEEIGDSAFNDCNKLERVVISDTITTIGNNAFDFLVPFSSLKEVVMGDAVEKIGNYAFRGCDKLKTIKMPGSVKEIGEGAFDSCEQLEKVKLNEGLEKIGEGAFRDCKRLKEINIPSSLKYRGKGVFKGCAFLEGTLLNKPQEYYNNLLIKAIRDRNLDDVAYCVSKCGADVNTFEIDGVEYNPLHLCIENRSGEIFAYLLSQGADVKARIGKEKLSLLSIACSQKDPMVFMVVAILEHGGSEDIYYSKEGQKTPMQIVDEKNNDYLNKIFENAIKKFNIKKRQ